MNYIGRRPEIELAGRLAERRRYSRARDLAHADADSPIRFYWRERFGCAKVVFEDGIIRRRDEMKELRKDLRSLARKLA